LVVILVNHYMESIISAAKIQPDDSMVSNCWALSGSRLSF